jgi:predicted nucleic acid-binding protein
MTLPLFVSDSSPIIAFEHLDLLDLLRQLTNALYVPPAVRREVFAERAVPSWIKVDNGTLVRK